MTETIGTIRSMISATKYFRVDTSNGHTDQINKIIKCRSKFGDQNHVVFKLVKNKNYRQYDIYSKDIYEKYWDIWWHNHVQHIIIHKFNTDETNNNLPTINKTAPSKIIQWRRHHNHTLPMYIASQWTERFQNNIVYVDLRMKMKIHQCILY